MTIATENEPALETGWQPTTPVADTLLRRFMHNHADYIHAVCRDRRRANGAHR